MASALADTICRYTSSVRVRGVARPPGGRECRSLHARFEVAAALGQRGAVQRGAAGGRPELQRVPASSAPRRTALGTRALLPPRLPELTPQVAGVVTNAASRDWGQNAHVAAGAGGDVRHALR